MRQTVASGGFDPLSRTSGDMTIGECARNWLGNLDPGDPQQKFNDFNKRMK